MAMRSIAFALTLSALTSQSVSGDEVRRTKFAAALWSTWALHVAQCTTKDDKTVTISEGQFDSPDSSCNVQWIVERATARGATYGVHARCVDRLRPDKVNPSDFIIRLENSDLISIGKTFDDLKSYQRCPAK